MLRFLQWMYLDAMKHIPLSLKLMISSFSKDVYNEERKKIRNILGKDIFSKGKFSVVGISIVYPQQLILL